MRQPISKVFEKYDLLQKTGQYTQIPKEVMELGNVGSPPDEPTKRKIKKLSGPGKINPKDFDKLVKNQNLEVLMQLAEREDLTGEQKLSMISHQDRFARGHNSRRDQKAAEYKRVMIEDIAKNHPETMSDALRNSNNHRLLSTILGSSDKYTLKSDDLFHMVNNRKDLPDHVWDKFIDAPFFGRGHASEIVAQHDNPERIVNAIKTSSDRDLGPDQRLVNAAFHRQNDDITANILNNISVDPEKVREYLDHANPEVVKAAAKQITTPDQSAHIVNNLHDHEHYGSILRNMIAQSGVSHSGRNLHDSNVFFEHVMDKVVDHIAENKTYHNFGYELWRDNKNFSPETLSKIAQLSDDTKEAADFKTKLFENRSNELTPDIVQQAIDTSSSPEVLSEVPNHQSSTPEMISQAYKKTNWDFKGYIRNPVDSFANNPNSPSHVIADISNKHFGKLGNNARDNLIRHPNLPTEIYDKFTNHPDANVRSVAALNPSAQDHHIRAGLKDKDKTVRAKWMRNPALTPEHQKMALKDRAPSNHAELMQNPNLSPDVIHDVFTQKKKTKQGVVDQHSDDIKMAALEHANVAPGTLQHILENLELEKYHEKAMRHPNISPEQFDQAKQSGLNINSKLPMHQRVTYDEVPKSIGYQPGQKSDVMPNHSSPYTQSQNRKLIKSLQLIKYALTMLDEHKNKKR